jgi:hypothetical protein
MAERMVIVVTIPKPGVASGRARLLLTGIECACNPTRIEGRTRGACSVTRSNTYVLAGAAIIRKIELLTAFQRLIITDLI